MVKRLWTKVLGWWLPWRNTCSELDYSTHHLKPGVDACIWNPGFGVIETRRTQNSLASLSRQRLSTDFRDRPCFKTYSGEGYRKTLSKDVWILNTEVRSHTVIQKGQEACNIECVVSYFEIANFNLMIWKAEMGTGERKKSSENEKDSGSPKRRYYLKCRTMARESFQWGQRGEQVFSLVKCVSLW